ncbi:MAG: URC4/urg3 family protein [Microvirga sp.]
MPDHHSSAAADAARRLLSAAAVRERSHALLERGLAGRLEHFTVDLERLGAAADEVVATIRQNYPTLEIPFHARWRHFSAGGLDRWGSIVPMAPWMDAAGMARAAFDLAIVSVLLDAGAGPDWRYAEDRTGEIFLRSEGLAVASFEMFISGAFSSRPDDPFRVDAEALIALTPQELASGFQVGPQNPLLGVEGRARLLNRLGRVVAEHPETFGRADSPRPGGLFDLLAAQAQGGNVSAPDILGAILLHLGAIWPGRITLGGFELGDTWRYPLGAPAPEAAHETDGLVPFHKLSQWLTYSLVEPLGVAGIEVTDLDALTGLPEYRNGGLLIDLGALVPKHSLGRYRPGDEFVVEWRALTVALLDRVAEGVRRALNLPHLPLANVLQGGTWTAGRKIAAEKRPGGGPPVDIDSDGTVF